MKILFKDIDEPGLNTLQVYERRGGYQALRKALAAMADLEVQSRGGELSEDTEAVRAVLIATR